jgi:hypothetical protein
MEFPCSCVGECLVRALAIRTSIADNHAVQNSLKDDLRRLDALAYHRLEWSGDLVREFHRLRKSAGKHPDFDLLEKVCVWLLVPLTLWPIDFHGLCAVVQQRIGAGERLENELHLLIESLPPLPSEKVQQVVAAHEHEVQHGDYEAQVKPEAGEKYRLMEERLMKRPQFRDDWEAIKAQFDVTKYQDYKHIIRRRRVSERAFRDDGWNLDWTEPGARFQALFDVFCHRWNLYGMDGDRPLLMKLTVNLTPHGTMIFIPSWWSLDHTRDFSWPEIKKLHHARVASKQGAKLTRNQMEQDAEAEKAARLDAEAKAKGLKGERRADWVMEQLGWGNKDPRQLRRVLSRAKKLRTEASP